MINSQLTTEIFTRLLVIPDNKACFDCQAPHVSFTSIDHGIFLCNSCAQAHQKLLPGRSTIRSIDNEPWSEAELNLMIMGGNIKFRNFCEIYRFPKDYNLEKRYNTIAVEFYRNMLKNQLNKKIIPDPPSIEDGCKLVPDFSLDNHSNLGPAPVKFEENTPENEIIDKTFDFFEKVSVFTKQKIKKLEEKIKDPAFQEDVKQYSTKVATTSKEFGKKAYTYVKEKFNNNNNNNESENDKTENIVEENNYDNEERKAQEKYQFPNPDDKLEKTLDYLDQGYEKVVNYEYGKKFKAFGKHLWAFSKQTYEKAHDKWQDPEFQEGIQRKKQAFIEKTKETFENVKKKL